MRSGAPVPAAGTKPVVVQHSFGEPGSGGPIGALDRILRSDLTDTYHFVRMHQEGAASGLDLGRIHAWIRLLRDVRPDLVHVRGLGNEGFHGALAARLAGCPRVLVSIHGTQRDLVGPRSTRTAVVTHGLEPATLRLATHVTTVCHYAASRDFIRRCGRKLMGPITNGVDLPEEATAEARAGIRAELDIPASATAVVSVGRLTFDKGHGDLADALRRLPSLMRQGLVLVLVGDGPDAAEIRRRYTSTGVPTRFLGRRLDVPRVLAGCDVFAFPTLHENLSNALLEAMAHGLPVVATRVGGNTEVLDGGAGWLVDTGDPAALAGALQILIADSTLRKGLGSAAQERVRSRYSTHRMVEVLHETYQQILASGP